MKNTALWKAARVFSVFMIGNVWSAPSYGAELVTRTVEYRQDGTVLQGYLVYDPAQTGKRPGVLVVHEWNGLSDFIKSKAEALAKLGYVAFAADIYGKGVRPETAEASAAEAKKYRTDRKLMRARAQAGLEVLKKQEQVDASKVAAIGFCFGGTTVLELARSGADVKGVVSFHGGLDTPTASDAKNIKGRVLILHGAIDPNVPPSQVSDFESEMQKAGVDWQLIAYGGAVHSFTNPKHGTDISKGVAYNEKADHRSWAAMRQFFDEIFGKVKS